MIRFNGITQQQQQQQQQQPNDCCLSTTTTTNVIDPEEPLLLSIQKTTDHDENDNHKDNDDPYNNSNNNNNQNLNLLNTQQRTVYREPIQQQATTITSSTFVSSDSLSTTASSTNISSCSSSSSSISSSIYWLCILFGCLGLFNNVPFVLMLASAKNISEGGTGIVYVVNTIPGLCMKLTAPYWFDYVPYPIRIQIATFNQWCAFMIVATAFYYSTSNSSESDSSSTHHMIFLCQLCGVALISSQIGLGEATLLALAGKYDNELHKKEQHQHEQQSTTTPNNNNNNNNNSTSNNSNCNRINSLSTTTTSSSSSLSLTSSIHNHHDAPVQQQDVCEDMNNKKMIKTKQGYCLTSFSSGTGLAGPIGYLIKIVFTNYFHFSISFTMTFCAIVLPFSYYISFLSLQHYFPISTSTPPTSTPPPTTTIIHNNHNNTNQNHDHTSNPPSPIIRQSDERNNTIIDRNTTTSLSLFSATDDVVPNHHHHHHQTTSLTYDHNDDLLNHVESSSFGSQDGLRIRSTATTKNKAKKKTNTTTTSTNEQSVSLLSNSHDDSITTDPQHPHLQQQRRPWYYLPNYDYYYSMLSTTTMNHHPPTHNNNNNNHKKAVSDLSTMERFQLVLSFWPYMIPLFVVYAAEYTCQAGAWTAIGYPFENQLARTTFYQNANWLYQVGVFVSRSTGTLCTVSMIGLWCMPGLQVINLLYFTYVAAVMGTGTTTTMPLYERSWFLYMMSFYTGLLGGGVYVHGYKRIVTDVPEIYTEFALSSTSIGESFGVLLADITGLFLQSCLYEHHGIGHEALVQCPFVKKSINR